MQITHEGWSQERGWFKEKYNIDTTRTDHEIRWKRGFVAKQVTPFGVVTRDWNNDGDVYSEFGAYFQSPYGGNVWYTPQGLLSLILDNEAMVPGIKEV